MERKYINNLLNWLNDKERKPLMVWGARQVGKSYLIEELFAKKYFKNMYLKIDLSDDVDFVEFAKIILLILLFFLYQTFLLAVK